MNAYDWQRFPAARLTTDADLQAHWDRLNGLQLDRPSMAAEIVTASLDALGNKAELLLVASVEGQIVAMLVLVACGLMRWCTFQPMQGAQGAWVADRHCSPIDLCRSLLRGPLGLSLSVSITQVDAAVAPRQDDIPDILTTDGPDTAMVAIAGSFDDYWAAHGHHLQQSLREQRDQLAVDGVEATFRVLRQPQEMAAAIARYGRLESAVRAGGEGKDVHPGNRHGRFYIQLFEAAARRSEAIVFEYLLDGKLAAVDLCLLRAGVLTVVKTACEQRDGTALTPDLLLREETLRHLFADGQIKRIEYIGPHLNPPDRLTDGSRPVYDLTAFRWPLVKTLASQCQSRPGGAGDSRPAAAADARR